MKHPITVALLGALALGAASLLAEPASALPVSGLSSSDRGGAVEEVRYFHRGYARGFGFRRGYYGYRRPYGYGYRRPGPVRRLLNHL